MLKELIELIPHKRVRSVAYTAGGLGALVAGQRVVALSMVATGLKGLEACWREDHPEFSGGLVARWNAAVDHYGATRKNDVNQTLQKWGVPLALGGAAGLLFTAPLRPLWWVSASSFVGGAALCAVGQTVYEKDLAGWIADPVACVAGPLHAWTHPQKHTPAAEPETVDAPVNMASGAVA